MLVRTALRHSIQTSFVQSRSRGSFLRYFAKSAPDSKSKPKPNDEKEISPDSNTKKDPNASSMLTKDVLEQAGMDIDESGRKRKGWENTARKEGYQSSTDIKREKRSNLFYALILGGVLGGAVYMARDWEPEEETRDRHTNVPNGYSLGSMFGRVKARTGEAFQYFNEPVFDKLLPDPLPEPYQRPLTLVLGLDDVLVHSEWDRQHGWRTAKRPGVDYFLRYLSQYYEVVIFSSKYQAYSEKPIMALDPYRSCISYALYREATRYTDGKIVKDLNHLNRDLSKTVIMDCEQDAFSLQPANAVPLKPWKGDPSDQQLIKAIPFLEWLATQPVKDVRPILKSFEGTDIPDEYARREAEARRKFEKNWKEEQSKVASGNWAAKFLGVAPPVPPTPMMPQDYIRQEGQKGYEAFDKYLKENGEKMLAEEKKREKEMLNSQKLTLKQLATEGLPNAEDLAAAAAAKERELNEQRQK